MTSLSQPAATQIATTEAKIRVLEVLPGHPGSPSILCHYHDVSLNDEEEIIPYEILLYSENDDNCDYEHIIYIGDAQVSVSLALFDALQRFRLPAESRYLWLDALHSDQSEAIAGTPHATLLDSIYERSEHCIIWLGQLGDVATFDAHAAFGTIGWYAGFFYKRPGFGDRKRQEAASETLRSMINSPFWNSIWTLREGFMSHLATLYWGPCSLSWDVVEQAAENLIHDGTGAEVVSQLCGLDGAMNMLTSSVEHM